MKKRILSLLLVLTLLVTVSVFAVEASEVEKIAFDESTAVDGVVHAWCEACQKNTDWDVATYNTAGTALAVKEDHIYIPAAGFTCTAQNVVGNNATEESKFCLYLNGDLTRDVTDKTGGNIYLFRMYTSQSGKVANKTNIMNVMGNGTAKMAVTGTPTTGTSNGTNGVIINTSTMTVASGGTPRHIVNIYDGAVLDATGLDMTGNTNKYGAALAAVSYGTINIYGGEIKGGKTANGGTVYTNNGVVNIYDGATITGGDAVKGGAVYVNGTGELNMHGGSITGGTANYGGAVNVAGGTFNMDGGSITGSTVTYGGGAVHMTGGTFNLNGGSITGGTANGTANATDDAVAHGGGAVHVLGGTFNLDGGSITGGKATRYGGAVHVTGLSDSSYGTMNIKSGTISGGSTTGSNAQKVGGNLAVSNYGVVNMTGGTLTQGVDSKQGWMGGNVGVCKLGTFVMNGAQAVIEGGYADRGGCIGAFDTGEVELLAGTVQNGKASNCGGCVWTECNSFLLDGATIQQTKEAAIKCNGNCVGVGGPTFTMESGSIIGYQANQGAAVAVYAGGMSAGKVGKVVMEDGTITGGAATNYGGSVYVVKGSFTMNNGTIQNGTLAQRSSGSGFGGNVYVTSADASFTMNGGSITGGSGYARANAYRGGNVCLDDGGSFVMENGTISGGNKISFGANVLVVGESSFEMKNGTITGAEAYNRGSVMVANGSTFAMSGGTINGGTANTSSSAVHTEGTFNMTGGTIDGGSATYGGAVYVGGGTFTMNGANALITSGEADYGGCVFIGWSAYGTGLAGTFELIDGTVRGGDKAEVGGCFYVGNTGTNGGAITADHLGTLRISGGTVEGGKASTGGNIEVRGNDALVTAADEEAGTEAVYAYLPAVFEMTGGTISGGTANGGGNIRIINNAQATIGGTAQILDGTAESGHGGNIYITNTAAGYAEKTILNITGGTIAGGQADSSTTSFGGNIAVFGTEVQFAMTDGLVSADNPLSGRKSAADQGLNIGIYSTDSVVKLTGGTLDGVIPSGKQSISLGSQGGKLSIGAVTTHNAQSTGNDLYLVGGVATIADGFADTLVMAKNSDVVFFKEDGVTVNGEYLGADGTYNNQGTLIVKINGEAMPLKAAGTDLVVAEAAVFDGKNIISVPADAQAAMSADIGAKQYVKLFNAPNAVLSLTKDITVDFNGNDATVTLDGNVLTGMDSQTDDYTAEGAATVTINGEQQLNNVVDLTIVKDGKEVNGQRKYLYLNDGFHRYYLSIDKAGLRTDSNDGTKGPGISFSGVYRGDEVVAAAVDGYGVEFQVNGNKTPYAYDAAFAATQRNEGKLLAVHGMMNDTYGETEVAAQAYITVDGETIYSTETASNNLKALVEGYVADYNADTLIEAFRAPIAAMVEKYGEAMRALQWAV